MDSKYRISTVIGGRRSKEKGIKEKLHVGRDSYMKRLHFPIVIPRILSTFLFCFIGLKKGTRHEKILQSAFLFI